MRQNPRANRFDEMPHGVIFHRRLRQLGHLFIVDLRTGNGDFLMLGGDDLVQNITHTASFSLMNWRVAWI